MRVNEILNINVLMYAILFIIVIRVALVEYKDWKCPDVSSPAEECGEHMAMPYRGSKPDPTDSCGELLDKIDIAGSAEGNSIRWRRSFVMAFMITLLMFILIVSPGKLPIWYTFYLGIIVSGLVIYGWMDYYSYHLFKVPTQYIHESTNMLRSKCVNI